MLEHNPFRRFTAMALSLVMVLTLAPMTAFAEETTQPLGASGEIIAFAPLDEEIAIRGLNIGASVEDVLLPNTLTATVQAAASTGTQEEEAGQDLTTEEIEIPAVGFANRGLAAAMRAYTPLYPNSIQDTHCLRASTCLLSPW